jgi:hypothetical protein
VCPFDLHTAPGNIALGVVISAPATYTVQYTYDDVFSPTFNPATATWFPHATLAALSANGDGNFAFTPSGCRLNQTAGAGSAILTVRQSGLGL